MIYLTYLYISCAVGATIGMTIALRGFGAVVWSQKKSEFPYVAGVHYFRLIYLHTCLIRFFLNAAADANLYVQYRILKGFIL